MKTERIMHSSTKTNIDHSILDAVERCVSDVKLPLRKNGVSSIKTEILKNLYLNGWCEEVQVNVNSKITITSMFDKIGLCLQTGNVSRIYADLLKLQTLFMNGIILAGIIIVPDIEAARSLGSNMANSDRLMRELPIYASVITLPMVVISFGE